MTLETGRGYTQEDMTINLLSKDHIQYYSELNGIFQTNGKDNPNFTDFEIRGKGTVGVVYRGRSYDDQPWSIEGKYQWGVMNRFKALVVNQNPNIAEGDTTGDDLVIEGGAISIAETIDIFENQYDSTRANFIQSNIFLNSRNNEIPTDIPLNADFPTIAMAGVADRGFMANKPVFLEGWGHRITTSEQAVPDDTVQMTAGCLWLRRDSAALVGTPKKVYKATSSTPIATGVIGAVTANPRYTAIVAYETAKDGYSSLAYLTVDGSEAATPVRVTEAAIETAVDAASSLTNPRWCCIVQVLVTETTTVVINTADIFKEELPSNTLTFYNTALAFNSVIQSDAWFIYDYLAMLKDDGSHKRNTNNISSQTSGTIVYGGSTTNMQEIAYYTDPLAVWNPLQA